MPKARKKALGPGADLATRLVHALNHPLRVRILESLSCEAASASQLSKSYGVSVWSVSYHLCTVLFEECGLVAVVERHQRRGAEERVFALTPASRIGVAASTFLRSAADALEAGASDPQASPPLAWQLVAVDEDGRRDIDLAMGELLETVKAVEDRCARSAPGDLRQVIVGAAAVEAAPTPRPPS